MLRTAYLKTLDDGACALSIEQFMHASRKQVSSTDVGKEAPRK